MSHNGRDERVNIETERGFGYVGPGLKMPETRPADVSKKALMRTTSHIEIEGRKRTINFSTLPSDTFLSGPQEDLKVMQVYKGRGGHKVGVVNPGPEDGEKVGPELVVLKQNPELMTDFMEAEGQSYKLRDPEIDIAADFVIEHSDMFPPPSIFIDRN